MAFLSSWILVGSYFFYGKFHCRVVLYLFHFFVNKFLDWENSFEQCFLEYSYICLQYTCPGLSLGYVASCYSMQLFNFMIQKQMLSHQCKFLACPSPFKPTIIRFLSTIYMYKMLFWFQFVSSVITYEAFDRSLYLPFVFSLCTITFNSFDLFFFCQPFMKIISWSSFYFLYID